MLNEECLCGINSIFHLTHNHIFTLYIICLLMWKKKKKKKLYVYTLRAVICQQDLSVAQTEILAVFSTLFILDIQFFLVNIDMMLNIFWWMRYFLDSSYEYNIHSCCKGTTAMILALITQDGMMGARETMGWNWKIDDTHNNYRSFLTKPLLGEVAASPTTIWSVFFSPLAALSLSK